MSRYPQPDNEDAFEQMCLRFYRKLWKNESLILYAKRGENQDGVDIHDPLSLKPNRAVQCKHHEPTKTLPPAEIKREVRKAEQSMLPIERYVIATTAKKTKNAQDTAIKLNNRPESERRFTVEIHFWEDICERLSEFSRFQAESIVAGHDAMAELVGSLLQDPDVALVATRALGIRRQDAPSGTFGEIERLLNDRELEAAQHELDKLPTGDALAALSSDDQYKILRLRAKLALESGFFELASQLFLAAFDKRPDLEQSKHNRVLGYALVHDSSKAYELACQYLAEGLATPVMLGRLVETASTRDQILERFQLFEPYLATDQDLNVALSLKFLRLGDDAGATDAAARALTIAPQSPHSNFVAALTAHNAAVKGDWRERKAKLSRAIAHYDVALREAIQNKYANLLPEILVNRAAAHMLNGDRTKAADDYRAAAAPARTTTAYAARAVSFFLHEQQFDSAWELLGSLDRNTQEGRFLTAITEFHTTTDVAQRRRYLEALRELAQEYWPRAGECRLHGVNGALLLKDHALARSFVPEEFQRAQPFQAYTALAWIDVEDGQDDAALANANRALDQSPHDAHPTDLRLLADILNRLHQDAKALDLLEQVATPGVFNEDMQRLVICAQRLQRHDLLLRVCRELRATGQQDESMRRAEIQLLYRYAPAQGIEVADHFIATSPAPAYFLAFRNMLAVRFNERERLVLESSRLPSPGQLSPKESRLVVMPYVSVGRYTDAGRFLHAQLRLYFEDEAAHGNFVAFFLQHGEKTSLREPPAVVTSESAALLSVEKGPERWVVIENENPLSSRGEFAETSEVASRLIGRAIGDVIELPGLALSEKATVRAIQTKFVRAFQDSLTHFHQRFPDTPFLQQVHVGTGNEFDPAPIIATLKERRAFVEKCFEVYATEPCPLYLFATRVGISELEAIKALAHRPGSVVKCSETTPYEFAQAVQVGLSVEPIVMDISAIVTLTLLDAWQYVDPTKKYIVSQNTKDTVNGWLQEAADVRLQEGGHVSVTEHGDLVFQDSTEDQRSRRLAELEKMQNLVETHCDSRSSEGMAALAPERRRTYEQVVGFHNIESMSLAKEYDALLWSDDLVLGLIAQADFGVKRIWTQLALRCFVDSGSASIGDFNLGTAKLAAWDYVNTVWSPETVISAGHETHWETQEWPFKQCIDLIAKAPLPIAARARIALECLKLLRRTSCVELRQSAVIQAILTAVGNREAVVWMARHVNEEFALDRQSAMFLRPEFEYWLRSHLS
jgi:hypothetical protein